MLATILFQLLAVSGMALLGWWLCFDEDEPRTGTELMWNRNVVQTRQRRSAA